MKAIKTKYVGPGNVLGSRIIASDSDKNRVILHYRSELNSEENHRQAAVALCEKMQWKGTWHGGHTEYGMVWVDIEDNRNQFSIRWLTNKDRL